MRRLHNSRFFRCLVCLLVICCVLVNCSPIRVEAVAVDPVSTVSSIGFLFFIYAFLNGFIVNPPDIGIYSDIPEMFGKHLENIHFNDSAEQEIYLQELQEINNQLHGNDSDGDGWNDDLSDPEASNLKIGELLRGLLASFLAKCIGDGFVDRFPGDAIPEGYASFNGTVLKTLDMTKYPYSFIVYHNGYDCYYWYHTEAAPFWEYSTWYRYNCTDGWRYDKGDGNSWSYGGRYLSSNPAFRFYDDGVTLVDDMIFIWSSHDILYPSGSLFFPATSAVTSDAELLYPAAIVGDVAQGIQNGTHDESDLQMPGELDLSEIFGSSDSVHDDLKSLADQLSNGEITREEFFDRVNAESEVSPDDGDTSDGGESEITPAETTPSDGTDTGSLGDYTLDLSSFFPFCIPFDLYDFLVCLNADPVAPVIEWEIPLPDGSTVPLSLDLSPFDSVAQLLRRLQLLLFCVGLAFKTRDLIKG